MAKRPLKLTVRIPPYQTPRNAWRKKLHIATLQRQRKSKVVYKKTDKLEVKVRLYMNRSALRSHDVDNRLKDVLDALQGRAGGSKRNHTLASIIPNDNQIYRVIMEKASAPKQSHGMGHLIVRRYKGVKY